MTGEFSRKIEPLRSQVQALKNSFSSPGKLEGLLLEACNGLLSVLDQIQGSEVSQQKEIQDIDQRIQDNIQNILHALEATRSSSGISEERYRAIVETQTELICRVTPDGTLTFFNEAFRSHYAAHTSLAIGENLLQKIPESERNVALQYMKTLSPGEPVIHVDYAQSMPDGSTAWQQWTGLGSFDVKGRLVEVQAVGHDITDRKLAEIAARQHNRELSALHNATVALLSTLDPDALLSRILDAAISAVPVAAKGMIHLIAADTGQLEMRASIGYSDPRIVRIRVPTSSGYVARAVRDRTPLLLHHRPVDAPLADRQLVDRQLVDGQQQVGSQPVGSQLVVGEQPPDGQKADGQRADGQRAAASEFQSAIVAPLVLKNQVLGALSLESDQVDAFSENDLRLLVSFAATATAAIHNAHLHSEVQKLAITDALTGLYNRRGFYELGQREVERSRRYRRPLVAIMMDIDHFKFINDFYGHPAGDQVLQTIAKRCAENLRRIDILGRLGGDEFTFLLPETDMFTASGVAERIRQNVANRPVVTEATPVNVSVSMGIARATATTPDLDVLISRADSAMYTAKKEGRNRVEFG